MYTHNNALINDELEIFSLLKRIQKSKQLISISFKSLPHYSLTTLLDVHLDEKLLIFDEPNPSVSQKLIMAKNEAEFYLTLDKLPVIFKTNLVANDSDKKLNYLYTQYPEEVYYPQSRNYYRFRTEFIDDINTTIFLSPTKRLECELVNISLEGLCLRFPYSFAPMFNVNQLIDDIYIQLPDEDGFSITAKVQNKRIENNYASIAVGLHIHQQKSRIEKTIQKFIFRTEN